MSNIKTTVGGLIALVAVGLLVFHQVDLRGAVELLGIAGGWIGITSADSKKN